jgi:hypothetical protein
MALFDIDYNGLTTQLLPVKLRNSRMTAWLRSLVSQVKWLYTLFKTNRNNNLYILAHDSQVCYLEAALNDLFDPVSRGIQIVDGPFEDPLFIYLIPENKPVWLGLGSEVGLTSYPDPQILFTGGETVLLGICFIVRVPLAVAGGAGYDVLRLRALVDFYRLPGRKNYGVVTY